MNRRDAFTLVEMMVVLLILATAAGAVALRTGAVWQSVQMRDVLTQIADYDRSARTWCRDNDKPLRVQVDLENGRLDLCDEEGRPLPITPWEAPRGYRFARLIVRTQDVTMGRAVIGCSRQGLTPSYGLLLEGPLRQRRWIALAGLSGQAMVEEHDKAVQDMLAGPTAPAGRPDAR
jgi:prepilin-type N-terminal cleavage/methylation domain-containing protein